MTKLTKPLTRKAKLILDQMFHARNRDRVIVTVYADGFIGFRGHKCRKEVRLPLSTVYFLVIREADRQAKAEAKLRRKR